MAYQLLAELKGEETNLGQFPKEMRRVINLVLCIVYYSVNITYLLTQALAMGNIL